MSPEDLLKTEHFSLRTKKKVEASCRVHHLQPLPRHAASPPPARAACAHSQHSNLCRAAPHASPSPRSRLPAHLDIAQHRRTCNHQYSVTAALLLSYRACYEPCRRAYEAAVRKRRARAIARSNENSVTSFSFSLAAFSTRSPTSTFPSQFFGKSSLSRIGRSTSRQTA